MTLRWSKGLPGPMQFIGTYTRRANGEEEVEYLVPELKDILSKTFGVIVYQEQIMLISQKLAGYSAGASDVLRKSVGKKKKELLDKSLAELKEAMIKEGQTEEIADEICKQIEPFAGYGFNRSHAAAYAYVACQTAYFKAHYPLEFFTSLLTVNAEKEEKVQAYIKDAKDHGISFLPPDINASKDVYQIEGDNTIRQGFLSIKGVGQSAIEGILSEQPYASLEDFLERCPAQGKKKNVLEVLALSGCFDSLFPEGTDRPTILLSMASLKKVSLSEESVYVINHWNDRTKLSLEKKYFGYYASGHPLDGIGEAINFNEIPDKKKFTEKVIVSGLREITTKKGDPMAFCEIEFVDKTYSGVIFPRTYVESFEFRKENHTIRDLVQDGMIVSATMHLQYNMQKDSRDLIIDGMKVPVKLNQEILDS